MFLFSLVLVCCVCTFVVYYFVVCYSCVVLFCVVLCLCCFVIVWVCVRVIFVAIDMLLVVSFCLGGLVRFECFCIGLWAFRCSDIDSEATEEPKTETYLNF